MRTEKEYKIAKRTLWICKAMLVLLTCYLPWLAYEYYKGCADLHQLGVIAIDIALFAILVIRNKKILKGEDK